MYNIIFSYGKKVDLGKCVITASDDTTLTQYYTTDDVNLARVSLFTRFTQMDILVGEKVFITIEGAGKVLLGRVSAVAGGVLTLTDNPGQIAYHEILRNGFISPFIIRVPDTYSYPISKYCGMSLIKKGEEFIKGKIKT